ncbi:hypothetical protein M33023_05360 [Candidatus Phytoplasma asteris]|uniref:Uncharacterized protein n=1 Tax=Candidatus Phytoplasma asteris TaxID=85620 RepID=A0ABZ2YHT8_9MOLU
MILIITQKSHFTKQLIKKRRINVYGQLLIVPPKNIIFIYHYGKKLFIKDKKHTLEAIINMKK